MKSLEEIRQILMEHKRKIQEEYGVVIVGIFGSYARDEQNEGSDIDILVEIEKPIGLKFFELWDKIEEILGTKVDLLTVKAVKQKPLLWDSVKEDIVNV